MYVAVTGESFSWQPVRRLVRSKIYLPASAGGPGPLTNERRRRRARGVRELLVASGSWVYATGFAGPSSLAAFAERARADY